MSEGIRDYNRSGGGEGRTKQVLGERELYGSTQILRELTQTLKISKLNSRKNCYFNQ